MGHVRTEGGFMFDTLCRKPTISHSARQSEPYFLQILLHNVNNRKEL